MFGRRSYKAEVEQIALRVPAGSLDWWRERLEEAIVTLHSLGLGVATAADPTDPCFREAQTFPRLGPDMLSRIAGFDQTRRVSGGGDGSVVVQAIHRFLQPTAPDVRRGGFLSS